MLSAVRQRATARSALIAPVQGRSTRAMHASLPVEHKSTRQRIAKEKVAQRYAKLVRKRSVKDMRETRREEKEHRAAQQDQLRHDEVVLKRQGAQEITDSLPPFTEEQLESMYRGLISAPPEQLALNAIEQPKAPALPDPTVENFARQDRLVVLSERLDELDIAPGNEIDQSPASRTSLTERLRSKRQSLDEKLLIADDAGVHALADRHSSPSVALLTRVEELSSRDIPLVPQASTSTAGLAASLPKGLLARSEWTDLALACAHEGDLEAVMRALRAMEATVPLTDGKILEQILGLYASEGRPQDAVKLTDFARKNSLPLSVTAHHHLLTSLLPSHPELAVRHLYSMEALGYTPLPATYTAIVSRLLSPSSSPTLIRKGWDLYAHSRLVSHPVPSIELYSTMIQACSRGTHPSPERAIDLFTELTEDNRLPPSELAYNGVIRSCAREGSQEYYYEALRYMRRMLDENVVPSKHTFHALLEGAKRHGDLARSRWILVKMVGLESDAIRPDENTLGLVFQSYASFKPEKPEKPGRRKEKLEQVVPNKETAERPSRILKPDQDPANVPLASGPSQPHNDRDAGPLALIELLGEASLFYPGPLPRTSTHVLQEAQNLMLQIVGPKVLGLNDANSTQPIPLSMFPDVRPSTFLLNAYLSILNSHSTLTRSIEFFDTAFERVGIEKNRFSFELIMKRCELGKQASTPEGIERAKKVFEAWTKWSGEPCPAVEELKSRQEQGEAIEEMEVERVKKEARKWEQERRNGRNISKMWGGLIRVLAKAFEEDEALRILRRFVELYPAAKVANYRPSNANVPLPDKTVTRVSLQLSSSLYPETAPSFASSVPPYLTFEDLKVLHLRFANMENKKGLAHVKGISRAYEAGLAHFRKWEQSQIG
ncbi:uncharacterized protein JCM15063_001087 [Sporobolomyces koalae]|uniref:uncharacterized protein n=1 Tax=Sporobolomyces koalae TaxID=500713 RepID=UPI00317D22D7